LNADEIKVAVGIKLMKLNDKLNWSLTCGSQVLRGNLDGGETVEELTKRLDKIFCLPIINIVIAPRPTRRKARTGLFFRRGYAH
jgi:hypothetical protein